MDTWRKFVEKLVSIESLRSAKEEAIEEWGEDIPVTLLFSILGRKIAEAFFLMPDADREKVFVMVEACMKEHDEELKTYVATGLLESLYSQASRSGPQLQMLIEEKLGESSRGYLLAWANGASPRRP
jgi:hypothetical protein